MKLALRRTSVAELPELGECARDFYASSQFLKTFDMARFQEIWVPLLESGNGVIFSLVDEGKLVGTIGGMVYQDIYSTSLIATEFFWFVRDGYRGQGLRLYRAFAAWAREKRCVQIRMVHLLDSMPEKLERVYRRLGFAPAEVHYVLDLKESQP